MRRLPLALLRASVPVALVIGTSSSARAQTLHAGAESAPRAELTARLAVIDSIATAPNVADEQRRQMRREAEMIQARLRDGDFRVGDRVVIRIRGLALPNDTLTVNAGRVIRLPELPEVPLDGVLHAELEGHVTEWLRAYVREPSVQAHALLRVAVLGQVARPGYYFLRTDLPLADVVMVAGGPLPDADLARSAIRRGGERLATASVVSEALQAGATLDNLHMRAGDEFVVGRRSSFGWQTTLQVIGAAASIVAIAVSVGNR